MMSCAGEPKRRHGRLVFSPFFCPALVLVQRHAEMWVLIDWELSSNTSKNQTSGHWRCKTMRKLEMCKNVKDLSIFFWAKSASSSKLQSLHAVLRSSGQNTQPEWETPWINWRFFFASLSNYNNQSESPSMLKQESDMKFIHFNKLMVTGW